jgi:hypothetical protein
LPTSYNSVTKEITAVTTRFGEFIFGWGDAAAIPLAPLQIAPVRGDSVNQRLPVGLQWNPRGVVSGYHLQVAGDPLFASLVMNDSMLTEAGATLKNITAGKTFYWKIRAVNGGQWGMWSDVWSFTAAAPYIAISAPAKGDAVLRGYPTFVQWKSNITDKVRIDLMRNSVRVTTIRDSAANVGAYEWVVPSSLAADTTYRLRIVSVADSLVFGTSAGMFSVRAGAVSVGEVPVALPGEFALDQNYPNPFNPATTIGFHIPERAHVSLTVTDILGNRIEELVNVTLEPGYKRVRYDAQALAAGVYFYTLRAGRFVSTRKFVVLK